jgi:hypothetical protein
MFKSMMNLFPLYILLMLSMVVGDLRKNLDFLVIQKWHFKQDNFLCAL